MRTWKILLHLLLTLLLSIGASGVVSAKVASGDQNLTWTGHQAENVFNWLTCQGKSDRSTTGPPECSVVPKEGKWKTPEEWAKHDHDALRDRLRKENEGFESGRHDEYSGSMEKELRRMADEADARGDLPEYGEKMRESANTYGKRARGARHKGGRRN
jgi:hypothetical protein